MTNTEVRDGLNVLLAANETTIGSKVLQFAASYTHLRDRIIVAPNIHASEAGEDEASPQFAAELERLQAASNELSEAVIPEL